MCELISMINYIRPAYTYILIYKFSAVNYDVSLSLLGKVMLCHSSWLLLAVISFWFKSRCLEVSQRIQLLNSFGIPWPSWRMHRLWVFRNPFSSWIERHHGQSHPLQHFSTWIAATCFFPIFSNYICPPAHSRISFIQTRLIPSPPPSVPCRALRLYTSWSRGLPVGWKVDKVRPGECWKADHWIPSRVDGATRIGQFFGWFSISNSFGDLHETGMEAVVGTDPHRNATLMIDRGMLETCWNPVPFESIWPNKALLWNFGGPNINGLTWPDH